MKKQNKKELTEEQAIMAQAEAAIAAQQAQASKFKELITIEDPYENFKLVCALDNWCLLTDGKQMLGVTTAKTNYGRQFVCEILGTTHEEELKYWEKEQIKEAAEGIKKLAKELAEKEKALAEFKKN